MKKLPVVNTLKEAVGPSIREEHILRVQAAKVQRRLNSLPEDSPEFQSCREDLRELRKQIAGKTDQAGGVLLRMMLAPSSTHP